jgi:hypothetical protein
MRARSLDTRHETTHGIERSTEGDDESTDYDDADVPKAKREKKLRDRLRRVLDWI